MTAPYVWICPRCNAEQGTSDEFIQHIREEHSDETAAE